MTNKENIRTLLMGLILLLCFGATIWGIIVVSKPEFVQVFVNGKLVATGEYHFEEGLFVASVGKDRDIQTGAGVIEFTYLGHNYRIEIPTDAQVTQMNLPELSYGDAYIQYKTDGFGSDTRLSRIKKNMSQK